MKLIVGLGNPGPRYETTRHNVGFLAVDRIADTWKASTPIKKFGAEVYETNFCGEKVLLVKPQSFMNLSGKVVGTLFNFYKCQPVDLIVIHDDLDIKPMSIRIKQGGGTAGHNGLKSIDEHIGSDNADYLRIRIGIGKPPRSGTEHVLAQFSDAELKDLDPLLDSVTKACELLVAKKVPEAMNQFNRREEQ